MSTETTTEQLFDVRLRVNGTVYDVRVPARRLLSDALRHDLGLTGTHVGCEHGVCGACTILADGRPVRSCLMLAVSAQDLELTTVEGLAEPDGALSPVQQAFRDCHGVQAGGTERHGDVRRDAHGAGVIHLARAVGDHPDRAHRQRTQRHHQGGAPQQLQRAHVTSVGRVGPGISSRLEGKQLPAEREALPESTENIPRVNGEEGPAQRSAGEVAAAAVAGVVAADVTATGMVRGTVGARRIGVRLRQPGTEYVDHPGHVLDREPEGRHADGLAPHRQDVHALLGVPGDPQRALPTPGVQGRLGGGRQRGRAVHRAHSARERGACQ
jgi:hypothetical protein